MPRGIEKAGFDPDQSPRIIPGASFLHDKEERVMTSQIIVLGGILVGFLTFASVLWWADTSTNRR
jgi:hypothetical protein